MDTFSASFSFVLSLVLMVTMGLNIINLRTKELIILPMEELFCYSIYISMEFLIYLKHAILMTQLFSQVVHH